MKKLIIKLFKLIIITILIYLGGVVLYKIVNNGTNPSKTFFSASFIVALQYMLFEEKIIDLIFKCKNFKKNILNVLFVDFIILYFSGILVSIIVSGYSNMLWFDSAVFVFFYMILDILLLH